ncbi:MAG: hypothetical protein ACKJSG_13090 [Lentisphaeria bacterium]|tara:strand:+ start:53 stop:244 length:192 start_codon:yes stop_codon:yes gene_type:complete
MIFRQTPDSKRDQVEREKAKAGNTEVMNILAMIYEQDMGVEADEETVKLWRDANANGVRKEGR